MSPRPGPRAKRSPAPRRGPASRPDRGSKGSSRAVEGLGGEQVEGRQAVLELLRAKSRGIRKILIADSLESADILDEIEELARRQRVGVQFVSLARLDKEARTEGHQGVVALAEKLSSVALDDLIDRDSFLLVCDGVTDPRNLGAMLRSADGAGVTGVVLPRHRSARVTPAVTKTAAGAIEHLRFAQVGGIASAIDQLNKAGVVTVGLAGESRRSLYDLDLGDVPVALVVGGEQNGLSQLVRRRCAEVVSIPQRGAISSLNAGVALSVAAFEVARQRDQR